jgi:biopolymer transport protein ExbB
MYPLLGFSVVALAIILERGLYFFITRERLDAFFKILGPEQPASVRNLREKLAGRSGRGYLSRMAALWLECAEDPPEAAAERIFVAGSELIREGEKRLAVLASVAHLSPLCGLFGTVLGMIEVFRKLESIGGRADVSLLSGGIWVALLTTAFGLLVAIPTLIAHHYFSGMVTGRSEDIQFLVSRLNVLSGRIGGSANAASWDAESGMPADIYETISAS